MPRPKGLPKTGGRVAGTPNKLTRSVRETFEGAFEAMQNNDEVSLLAWAKRNPTEFYRLASKLLPVDMAVQGGLTLNVVTGVPSAESDCSDLV